MSNNLTQNETVLKLKKSGFKDESIKDLKKSGLELPIIEEAQIKPATETELKRYGIYYWDKKRRQKRFEALYIIPYLITDTDKGRFCRVKVKPIPEYSEFEGKYTQPQKQFLKDSCHLYILPSELEKMKSPRCKIAIVEGEKKTLKLIQELRKIENELSYKIAVIGISGVNNWQTAPEWKLIPIKEKEFITFFDADSEYNTAVIKAELELIGFLYSKGVGAVKSALWSETEGKGIDDFLVNAGDKQLEKLKTLLSSTTSVFEKYKDRIQDKELLRALFKYPIRSDKARIEYLTELIKDETKIKKKTIESIIKVLRVEYQEELKEKLQNQLKEVFGTADINIPNGFLLEEGYLKDKNGNIITRFFIVDKKIINENNELVSLKLKFIDREFLINIEELNKKALTLAFNKNRLGMDEKTATKVLEYITQYQNINSIPEERIIFKTGWINDDYYLPQTKNYLSFDDSLLDFKSSGSKEKELELLKELFSKGSHLALGYIIGFATILIKPLNLSNFVIFNQGLTGKGKTTLNRIGLSIFGDNEKLIRNMNTTDTGLELFLDRRKDVFNVLDEINTANKDLIRQIVKIIYDFESGKGRTRAKRDLTLRYTPEYRGILSITSEDSLNHLLSKTDKTVKGALRRTIIIDYSEFENIDKDLTFRVYESISSHYGNLIKDWIEYVKANIDNIKKLYMSWIWELQNEDRGFRFNGQERHLALLFTVNELMEKVFNIDTENINDYLWQIAEFNHFEFKEATELNQDILLRKLEKFTEEGRNNFYFEYTISNEGEEKIYINNPKILYGELTESIIYLTPTGFDALARYLNIPEKELKRLLVKFRIADKGDRHIIKITTKRIQGITKKVYPLFLKTKK